MMSRYGQNGVLVSRYGQDGVLVKHQSHMVLKQGQNGAHKICTDSLSA